MKRLVTILISLAALFSASGAEAGGFVLGGFEAFGHVVAGAGYQKFSNDPVTGWSNDETFPGVIGAYIPDVAQGTLPAPGEGYMLFYVDSVDLKMAKRFGDIAGLRADLEFGRTASGSLSNFSLPQAYMTAVIPAGRGIEITVGRFWGPAGFEANDAYENEIISWSILTRGNIYPYMITGIMLSYEFSDAVELKLISMNGITNDTTAKINDVPAFTATLRFSWGEEDTRSTVGISPFYGPESGSNRHATFGIDVDWFVYLTKSFAIGGEGVFRRDNGFGGPNSDYAGGIFEIYYDFTDSAYGVARYTYCRQFKDSNGVLNLTGAKQQIHEASLAGGYRITDTSIIKAEFRFDYIDPAGAPSQWNAGAALAFAYGF